MRLTCILNKSDKFINFYDATIGALVCIIEKRDSNNNFILFNNVERHHFYLLIKINFHVSEVIELLEFGEKQQNFRYKGLLKMLRPIERNGNDSHLIHNGLMKV